MNAIVIYTHFKKIYLTQIISQLKNLLHLSLSYPEITQTFIPHIFYRLCNSFITKRSRLRALHIDFTISQNSLRKLLRTECIVE